jgi:phage gpG-like protein
MVTSDKPIVLYKINSAEYDAAVKDALTKVRSLKPVFRGIVKEFYITNRAIFKLKSSGKYPDFKGVRGRDGMTKYQRYKNKRVGGRGYPLLKFTGRLEESITVRGSEDAFEKITDKSLVVGTNVKYGVYHQQPERRGEIMPYRPFLFLDPSTTALAPDGSMSRRSEAWVRAIQAYVTRSLDSMGKTKGGEK